MAIVGLIPAAGRGKRLAPLPFPKELYPIGYQHFESDGVLQIRPKVISQYLVDHLVQAGATKLVIVLGRGKSDIMEYYADGSRFGVEIAYAFQEEAAGMPFALDLAFPWLNPGDEILFGMSDTIIEPAHAFVELQSSHRRAGADLTLGLFPTSLPQKFGMVEMGQATNAVVRTIDKPKNTDLKLMWGSAAWNFKFATFMRDYLKDKGGRSTELVFGDVLNAAIDAGLKINGHEQQSGKYIDVGTVEDLDRALKLFHLD